MLMLVVITGIASLAAIAGELVMVQDMHDLIRAAHGKPHAPESVQAWACTVRCAVRWMS
jgi:hypothetical protein